jgi:competence protein ComEC
MRWRGAEHAASLRDCLERELGERAGFQWLAVAFGAGCLIYFALPREPLLLALLSGSLAAAVGATIRYRRGAPWRIAGVVALCLAGATAGKLRVDSIAGPQIERECQPRSAGAWWTVRVGRNVARALCSIFSGRRRVFRIACQAASG